MIPILEYKIRKQQLLFMDNTTSIPPSPSLYLLCLGVWGQKAIMYTFSRAGQRYTYRVLQIIQMKLILLCVWAERAVLGSAKTALKYEICVRQYKVNV